MTRKEYLDANHGDREKAAYAHRAYFAQFVTDGVRNLVARTFTVPALLASMDEHLNDIPLSRWDRLVPLLGVSSRLLREAGDYLTLGTGVCILKEAARQIIEQNRDALND